MGSERELGPAARRRRTTRPVRVCSEKARAVAVLAPARRRRGWGTSPDHAGGTPVDEDTVWEHLVPWRPRHRRIPTRRPPPSTRPTTSRTCGTPATNGPRSSRSCRRSPGGGRELLLGPDEQPADRVLRIVGDAAHDHRRQHRLRRDRPPPAVGTPLATGDDEGNRCPGVTVKVACTLAVPVAWGVEGSGSRDEMLRVVQPE